MTKEEMQKQLLDAITSGKIQPATIIWGDNVQHKIENVEPGGIGIQINNGKQEQQDQPSEPEPALQEPPQTPEDELTDGPIDLHLQLFKAAMLKVQNVKYSEMKFATAIMNTYDWEAVIRLGQDIGLLDGYSDLISLMEEGDFKCKPTNPQNVNPYKKHINPEPL